MNDMTGKVALVTGGSGGIGAEICKALAIAGADVAVHYRSGEDSAKQVVKEVENTGRRAIAVQADMTTHDEVKSMFERVQRELGAVDVLVNNAGIDGDRVASWELDIEQWRKVLDINLTGAFACASVGLSKMVERKSGVVINISSVHETIPWAGYSAYAASKAGLSMLTKTMALESAEHGVRVVGVAPGAIKTPINEDVWKDPENRKDLESKIPVRKVGEAGHVAAAVVFLASDDAGYITGSTLAIDGGMQLYADFLHGG